MAYSFLIFDFGDNEEVAQQARHKVDGWKQGFRLGKKLELKFDRKEPLAAPGDTPEASGAATKVATKTKGQPKAKAKSADKGSSGPTAKEDPVGQVRLIVRLDFSDHEKLSHQRWLERIPMEEPFKTVNARVIRAGDQEFETTEEMFEALDRSSRGKAGGTS